MSYKHFLTDTDISTYRMPVEFNGGLRDADAGDAE